mmetsp:Transcript_19306/g.58236  ORF Transcript_19306/g.58236 Transcript_19306/m.58236 type:complete len:216 (-) Transcript_19306:624-1271(-)
MRNGAAVVGTIGLGVAFTRIVEAIVAIKIACSRVALRVTFAIIDVLLSATIGTTGSSAIFAIPSARNRKACLVAIAIIDPRGLAVDVASTPTAWEAVASVVVARGRVASKLALSVSKLCPSTPFSASYRTVGSVEDGNLVVGGLVCHDRNVQRAVGITPCRAAETVLRAGERERIDGDRVGDVIIIVSGRILDVKGQVHIRIAILGKEDNLDGFH